MTDSTIAADLQRVQALRYGHFLLSSGLHSPVYVQCAQFLQWPDLAARAGAELAERLRSLAPQVVVAPAMGGILIGHEVARALGVRGIFSERVDGKMALRRGFALAKDERVVIVEDVVTTGKSTQEVVDMVEAMAGEVVGFASLVNRSSRENIFPRPFEFLLRLTAETWPADSCPECRNGSRPEKPGSRVMS